MPSARMALIAAPCALALLGCSTDPAVEVAEEATPHTAIVQLGAPGEEGRELTAEEASELGAPSFTDADVEFVQMMIPHHEQALEMTALVEERTARDDMPLLSQRLDVSQRDEIAMMQRWLEERGEEPDAHGSHDHHGDELMPGMLSPEEMAELEAAEGDEFDRLFLQYMIRHHEGAVLMVEELLTKGEGGQEPQVFQLAQHIDADQRVEISRMKRLLTER